MSEVVQLVSWGVSQNKVPGSEWVCPINGIDAIQEQERLGREITDELIRAVAYGRWHHVEMMQFPEGYHAGRIVDSDTGRVLIDDESSWRYIPGTDGRPGRLVTQPLLAPIELSDERHIAQVSILYGSTETIVRPTQVDASQPDCREREESLLWIAPTKRALHLRVVGRAATIGEGIVKMQVKESASGVGGKLSVVARAGDDPSSVEVYMGPDGRIANIAARAGAFLSQLGIGVGDPEVSVLEALHITDREQQAETIAALSQALGIKVGNGFDLKATASGLYAAMGQRHLDIVPHLILRT